VVLLNMCCTVYLVMLGLVHWFNGTVVIVAKYLLFH